MYIYCVRKKNKISGVYQILNTLNNKRYIGSSVNIYNRFVDHKTKLNKNKHCNKHLQRAWNKYGEKHFKFEILETCEPIKDTLLFLEQKYLDLKPEYNIQKFAYSNLGQSISKRVKEAVAESNRNRVWSKESREKKRIISLNSEWNKFQRKPIIGIEILTNKIIRFNSICEAAIFTGHINHRVGIKRCLFRKQIKAYGFNWKLIDKNNDI
jgi:hypothetical protein